MNSNSSARGGDVTPDREAKFSQQVNEIIEKFEREFHEQESSVAMFEGESELEKKRVEFKRELRLMRVYLVENRPSIEDDDGEELKELIANKLAVSLPNKPHPSDWWWTPAEPSEREVLEKVQRALEKETKSRSRRWRQGIHYGWSVLTELIYLAIVVGVFSSANSRFETLVFSALVMIYNAVSSRITGVGMGSIFLMYRLEEVYGEIGRALGLKVSVAPAREAAKQITKHSATALIHSASIGIGSLIALWHLVIAIL